jgi:hypothetical protein
MEGMGKDLYKEGFNKPVLKPLYAIGVFHVCYRGGVGEYLVFRYYDKESYYHKIITSNPKALSLEKKILSENMQSFLDEEDIFFNGKRTKPIVERVVISSPFPNEAYISFVISFRVILQPGLNVYEDYYEETIAEYDYEILWRLPPGSRRIDARLGVPVEIENNVVYAYVKKGSKVGGYERISFYL